MSAPRVPGKHLRTAKFLVEVSVQGEMPEPDAASDALHNELELANEDNVPWVYSIDFVELITRWS